jgi:hypothetical protein
MKYLGRNTITSCTVYCTCLVQILSARCGCRACAAFVNDVMLLVVQKVKWPPDVATEHVQLSSSVNKREESPLAEQMSVSSCGHLCRCMIGAAIFQEMIKLVTYL